MLVYQRVVGIGMDSISRSGPDPRTNVGEPHELQRVRGCVGGKHPGFFSWGLEETTKDR